MFQQNRRVHAFEGETTRNSHNIYTIKYKNIKPLQNKSLQRILVISTYQTCNEEGAVEQLNNTLEHTLNENHTADT